MSPAAAISLDPLEQDALTELVNIGVSRAAASLRDLVGRQVRLSTPGVAIVSREEAARALAEREPDKLIAVNQMFEGELSGRALLIFPETNSLELVRAVTGGDLPLEDILALETEALAETGNIILNNALATIANLLQRGLKMSLPEILRGGGAALFDPGETVDGDDMVLFLYIDFSIDERDIRGYIAMVMDLVSLRALKNLIREFIFRSTGETSTDDDVLR